MHKHKRVIGFSLIELLVTISVVVIFMSSAAPAFSSLIEKEKLKRLATEIEWLFVLSKSESVMRSNDVLVTFSGIEKIANNSSDNWSITAMDKITNDVIASIKGADFKGVVLSRSFQKESVDFNSLTGRPRQNGSLIFNTDNNAENIKVKVSNMTGRIYTCSELGGYNYGTCS